MRSGGNPIRYMVGKQDKYYRYFSALILSLPRCQFRIPPFPKSKTPWRRCLHQPRQISACYLVLGKERTFAGPGRVVNCGTQIGE